MQLHDPMDQVAYPENLSTDLSKMMGYDFDLSTYFSPEQSQEAFKHLTLWDELHGATRDHHGRFDETQINYPAQKPRVNNLVNACVPQEILPKSKFQVVFSHDIDWISYFEPISFAKSFRIKRWGSFRSWIGWKECLDTGLFLKNLNRLSALEKSHNVKAIYFMLAGPYSWKKYRSRYNVSWQQSRKAIELLQSDGHQIGLHGSYDARDRGTYQKEVASLEEITGQRITTHRNHYLRFDPILLWEHMESAGVKHDFSVGYVNHIGFRAGSATPYYGYDFMQKRVSKVMEVPLIFMDRFEHLENKDQTLINLKELLLEVRSYLGCVSILFHPEMFLLDEDCWTFYESIILLCKQLGAKLGGPLP